jgi:hypothetical protein
MGNNNTQNGVRIRIRFRFEDRAERFFSDVSVRAVYAVLFVTPSSVRDAMS